MKKLLLLAICVFAFGCSEEEESNCKSVKGKQTRYLSCGGGLKCAVFFFILEGDSQQIEVSEVDYSAYDLNEVYCKK